MNRKCFQLTALLIAVACSNIREETRPLDFETGGALWLQDGRTLPTADSLFYLNRPGPLFRKEFHATKAVDHARLIITAAGYYQATINGKSIGENVLDPAWTDYSKRVYFTEYDVTALISEGANCIGVTLGNGFYNPLPLRKWGRRNMREDTEVGKPTFIARLVINYAGGDTKEIVSDSTWKWSTGPLLKDDVYIGVTYDARQEIGGWNLSGFDDNLWSAASVGGGPGGRLQKAFFPPVQITREIIPQQIAPLGEDRWIVDMGENFTGTYRAKLDGSPGDTITLRFGERLYEDGALNPMTAVIGQIKRKGVGGPGAPDVAWQTDTYIIGENQDDWFEPPFTYHVYRYMEIDGIREQPELTDVVGLSIHTNVEDRNSFSSSSELLNSIQAATERTFLANLVSVQSDCPAREKFGYGGDINATSESFIYNYDMQSFYRKTVYDWLDAMNDSSFVDTAPFVGIKYCGISWESAYLIMQHNLYLYYGDEDIVRELYDLNVAWMDKVARLHPEGVVDKGLSDHESLEPVPVTLTGTAHYLQCARIMAAFAKVVGDEVNQAKYQELAAELRDWLQSEFWDQTVHGNINRQTLFATLLYHDIVPEDQVGAATDSLLAAVKRAPAGHFITGIFGTKYVLEALSRDASPQVVFDVVNSTEYPGWGHMIDRGATTIWETWKESDNVYSNNHPMFGSVTEWFYRWLAGIRPDPGHPGFQRFILAPNTPDGLGSVSCTYSSSKGLIESGWRVDDTGTYHFDMSIPDGCTAQVKLPISDGDVVDIIEYPATVDPGSIPDLQSGEFQLTGGDYSITLTKGSQETSS